MTTMASASNALDQRARAYVEALEPDCTWTDGYVCAGGAEDSFLNREAPSRMIPGPYLRAWEASYRDFMEISDLSNAQKDLRHYRVGFTEDDRHYIVLFSGLLLPHVDASGRPDGVINAVFGRSVKYWVDKDRLEIRDRKYLP